MTSWAGACWCRLGRAGTGGRALGARAARLTEVPNGTRVRLYGVARAPDAPLTSPVLERPCVAYRLVVDEPAWRQVLERSDCTPFVVQDGDIAVRVRGPFHVLLQVEYQLDFDNAVQRRLAYLRDPTGAPALADELHRRNYRYFEALIRPGDRVAVEGFASVTVDPAGDREALREPPLLYTLSGTPDRPTVVSIPEPGSVAP